MDKRRVVSCLSMQCFKVVNIHKFMYSTGRRTDGTDSPPTIIASESTFSRALSERAWPSTASSTGTAAPKLRGSPPPTSTRICCRGSLKVSEPGKHGPQLPPAVFDFDAHRAPLGGNVASVRQVEHALWLLSEKRAAHTAMTLLDRFTRSAVSKPKETRSVIHESTP